MPEVNILRIPCATGLSAAAFGAHLVEQVELDGITVEGREVLIPCTGDPVFVFGIAEESAPWAHDDEAANAVREFLGEFDGAPGRA